MPTIEIAADAKRNLQDVADILARSKKVVVVTGAGISTNSGIPDFRSENGLYSLIQSQYDAVAQPFSKSSRSSSTLELEEQDSNRLPMSSQDSTSTQSSSKLPNNIKGKDLFDALVWSSPLSTSIFFTFIASLRKKIKEDVCNTTATHRFIRTLRDGGRLVRCYTQNIDGLESRDGLCTDIIRGKGNRARFSKKILSKPRPEGPIFPETTSDGGCEVVQLHGDLNDLRCGLCNQLCSWDEDDREAVLLGGEAPECRTCTAHNEDRQNRGKRGTAIGMLRPNVVLYGEEHPSSNLLSPITTHDLGLSPDVLLILGTSLRVHGLKVLVKEFSRSVHARGGGRGKVIFVNKTKPPESVWSDVIDFWVGMDCDDWVHDLRERRADIWERQGTLHLPVVKQPSSRAAIAKSKSPGGGKAVSKNDKENKVVRSGAKPKLLKENKPTAPKKPTSNKVDVTSPAQKATKAKPKPRKRKPLAPVSVTSINAADAAPPPSRPDPKAPSIPKKRSGPSASVADPPNTQLVTPPGSGRAYEHDGSFCSSNKRSTPTSLAEDELLASPSKRKRQNWEIWIDSET